MSQEIRERIANVPIMNFTVAVRTGGLGSVCGIDLIREDFRARKRRVVSGTTLSQESDKRRTKEITAFAPQLEGNICKNMCANVVLSSARTCSNDV